MNELGKRRRSLLANAGKDILWRVDNHRLTSGYIETGIKLFENKINWTIAFDITIQEPPSSTLGNSYRFYTAAQNDNNYNTYMGRYGASHLFAFMGNASSITINVGSGIGRYRGIITYKAGTGCTSYLRKNTGNAVVSGPINNPWKTSTHILTIGGTGSGTKLPLSQLNSVIVYNRVLSANEIDNWLGIQEET